jgi:MOSC domain-containing protein YiiM
MSGARILSVNVGQLQTMEFNGHTVYTGIFKTPVDHSVYVDRLTIQGDVQADLVNHGGALKAVYFYPSEHLSYWADILGEDSLAPGAMGENFTCSGLLEDEAFVGDRWKVGDAVVEITQPRSPCYKLALRYRRPDLVSRFLEANKPGFYASVVKEGSVKAGDAMTLVSRSRFRITAEDVFRLAVGFDFEPRLREEIADCELVPEFWRRKVVAHGGVLGAAANL